MCLMLLALAGCHGSDLTTKGSGGAAEQSDAPTAGRTEIERGPVKVSVEVQPHPARLSDEPTLTLTIDYDPADRRGDRRFHHPRLP